MRNGPKWIFPLSDRAKENRRNETMSPDLYGHELEADYVLISEEEDKDEAKSNPAMIVVEEDSFWEVKN